MKLTPPPQSKHFYMLPMFCFLLLQGPRKGIHPKKQSLCHTGIQTCTFDPNSAAPGEMHSVPLTRAETLTCF